MKQNTCFPRSWLASFARAFRVICRWMQYGLDTICSLYYDTPDHQLIRRSLEKTVYKEKLDSAVMVRPKRPAHIRRIKEKI